MMGIEGGSGQQHATLSSLIKSSVSTQSTPFALDFDDPASPTNSYLLSLTSKSLHDIRELPTTLSQSKISLNTQLSSLCSQHVSSFVQVHQATSTFPNTLSTLDATLQTLIDRDVPSLSDAAQQFSPQIEAPLKAKEKAQNLLSQYETSLKDLMDIPRLLMTCVRASHPVEALQLAIHMMKIESRNKHDSTIRSLQEECQVHMNRLREDLLRALGARGLRLPAAKRLVSLLRKLKEVDEARETDGNGLCTKIGVSDSYICLSYLHSRWAILEDLNSNSSTPKSSAILSSQLATWRDTVGDTCGMAQMLFPSSSDDNSSSEDELAPSTLIASFSRQALHLLQHLLANALPGLPEDSVGLQDTFETFATIHTKLSYSAASLSRQGVDISRMVSGHTILCEQVVLLWSKAMADAKRQFQTARVGKMDTMCLSWLSKDGILANDLLKQKLSEFDSLNTLSTRLTQIPDLRLLTNSFLEAYNALLSFAPSAAAREIVKKLDESLCDVIESTFSAMKGITQGEIRLSLSPIISSQAGSRYYERDETRQSEANTALLARILYILCRPVSSHLRELTKELFSLKDGKEGKGERFYTLVEEVTQWCKKADDVWIRGESGRQDRVREEEEKLATEEEAKREEEEEKRLAAELKKKKEEREAEAEAERQRLIREEEKRREEEEERQRKHGEAEEEKKRLAKLEEEEKLRQARIREEEEKRLRIAKEKEAEEELQRLQKIKEEEARRIEEEEMEKKRVLAAEEERQRYRDEETVEKLALEEEDESRLTKDEQTGGESIRIDDLKEARQEAIAQPLEVATQDYTRDEESKQVPQTAETIPAMAAEDMEAAVERDASAGSLDNDIQDAAGKEQKGKQDDIAASERNESIEKPDVAGRSLGQEATVPTEKRTKPGSNLAEKLRQRQEQRQKRAEESSPARAPE